MAARPGSAQRLGMVMIGERWGGARAAWRAVALVLVLALVPYLPTVAGGFVWDDHELIERNPVLERPWMSLGRMVEFGGSRSPYYRPVSILWWTLERTLFGLRPAGFHVLNMALHAGASLLVLALAVKVLPLGPAAVAAGLFAVHPVHVEAVAFSSAGATELLPALLLLGALVVLVPDSGPGVAAPGRGRLWSAALLYLLALLSKEMAIGLPLIAVLVLLRLPAVPNRREVFRLLAPFLTVATVYAAARLYAMSAASNLATAELIRPQAWMIVPWALTVARALLIPWRLLPYHELQRPGGLEVVAAVAAVAAGLAAAFALGRARRWDAATALGLGLLLVPLLPALPVFPRAGALISERFLYVPSAGLMLLLAAALDLVGRGRPGVARAGVVAAAALIVAGGCWSGVRSGDWRDDVQLFTRAAALAPRSPVLEFLRGDALAAGARLDEAEGALRRALALDPTSVRVKVRLADVLRQTQKAAEADALYRQAIATEPGNALAHFGLGSLEMNSGHQRLAAEHFETAVRLDPTLASAHINLGVLDFEAGRIPEAQGHWRRAVEVNPNSAQALNNLAVIATSQGRNAEARALLERALAVDPGYRDARENLKALGRR